MPDAHLLITPFANNIYDNGTSAKVRLSREQVFSESKSIVTQRMNGQTNEWKNKWKGELLNGQTYKKTDIWES